MTKNYSNLPTFHPVMMEIADIKARARYDAGTAKLAARRAAWLKAQGLPEKLTQVSCSQCGCDFILRRKYGFSRCVDHK